MQRLFLGSIIFLVSLSSFAAEGRLKKAVNQFEYAYGSHDLLVDVTDGITQRDAQALVDVLQEARIFDLELKLIILTIATKKLKNEFIAELIKRQTITGRDVVIIAAPIGIFYVVNETVSPYFFASVFDQALRASEEAFLQQKEGRSAHAIGLEQLLAHILAHYGRGSWLKNRLLTAAIITLCLVLLIVFVVLIPLRRRRGKELRERLAMIEHSLSVPGLVDQNPFNAYHAQEKVRVWLLEIENLRKRWNLVGREKEVDVLYQTVKVALKSPGSIFRKK